MKILLFFNTIYFVIYFVIITLITPFVFFPWHILKLFRCKDLAKRYMNFATTLQCKLYLWGGFVKREVKGLENLPPESEKICLIANHQGYIDVLAIASSIPYLIGFISKIETFRIPFLRSWLRGSGSIPLKRGNLRASLETINLGSKMIEEGSNIAIFPEGTRSRSNGMREFKKGSLKLAFNSNAIIVPITLDGTYKFFEEHKLVRSFFKIKITIHPAIETEKLTADEKKDLNVKLWELINSGLTNPNTEVLAAKPRKAKRK